MTEDSRPLAAALTALLMSIHYQMPRLSKCFAPYCRMR